MLGKSTSIYTYTYTYSSRKYAVCAESILANKVYIDVLPVWSCVAKSIERGKLSLQGSLASRKFPILSFSESSLRSRSLHDPAKKIRTWSVFRSSDVGGSGINESVVSDSFVTLWIVARQAPLLMGLPRREYWSGLSFPTPGHLPDPGIEPASLVSPA